MNQFQSVLYLACYPSSVKLIILRKSQNISTSQCLQIVLKRPAWRSVEFQPCYQWEFMRVTLFYKLVFVTQRTLSFVCVCVKKLIIVSTVKFYCGSGIMHMPCMIKSILDLNNIHYRWMVKLGVICMGCKEWEAIEKFNMKNMNPAGFEPKIIGTRFDWSFGWGSTSHSAIFQLYSDGTVVLFAN